MAAPLFAKWANTLHQQNIKCKFTKALKNSTSPKQSALSSFSWLPQYICHDGVIQTHRLPRSQPRRQEIVNYGRHAPHQRDHQATKTQPDPMKNEPFLLPMQPYISTEQLHYFSLYTKLYNHPVVIYFYVEWITSLYLENILEMCIRLEHFSIIQNPSNNCIVMGPKLPQWRPNKLLSYLITTLTYLEGCIYIRWKMENWKMWLQTVQGIKSL